MNASGTAGAGLSASREVIAIRQAKGNANDFMIFLDNVKSVARRIGLERMKNKLATFDHGNEATGDDIGQRFWLGEPLRISAIQQVEFLAKLAKGDLPVSKESVAQIKTLIRYGEKNGAVIYAKTGWTGRQEPQTGWWVGWVEKEGTLYPLR